MKSDGTSSVPTHTFIMHTFSDAIHISIGNNMICLSDIWHKYQE